MDTKTADICVKIYAVLSWLGAFFSVVAGLFMIFGGSFFASMLAGLSELPLIGGLLGGFLVGAGIIAIAFGVFEFYIGKGLWNHQNWARIVSIVFSVLGILGILTLNFVSAAIGAFGLYLFAFDEGAKKLFK